MLSILSITTLRRLYKQADACFDKNNFDGALILLKQLEKQVQKHPLDLVLQKDLTNLQGLSYARKGELEAAENSYLRSLEYCKQIGEPRFIANRYDNLAGVCITANRSYAAVDYLQKAIELKQASGNERDLGKGYLQLASVLFLIENLEGGKSALAKADHHIRKHKQKEFYHHLHFCKGMQWKREKNFKLALSEYNKAIKLSAQCNDLSIMLQVLHNKGCIYVEQGKWLLAGKPLNLALQLARKLNTKAGELMALYELTLVAFERKDLTACKEMLQNVMQEKDVVKLDMLDRDSLLLSSRLYRAEGKHAEALVEYEKYMTVYQRMYNSQMSRTVLDLQAKYESEKKERELQQSKLQQTESELKALRAQIDPHFIFNALNSIRKEVLEGNTEKVDEYLVRFSRLLRLILDSTRTPRLQLKEIIELLHLYIQIEQTRQDNRFSYRIHVGKGIDAARLLIPGLMLQPIVENAIVHGLYHRKGKDGLLSIGFSKKGNALQVKISDNGIGRKKSAGIKRAGHQSHALAIIRETLDLTWNGKGNGKHLVITDKQDKNGKAAGTEVVVLLPLA